MAEKAVLMGLTLEVSGRCHAERQITVTRRSGPLDRIVSCHKSRQPARGPLPRPPRVQKRDQLGTEAALHQVAET